jgi:parallel beta-helix repeat protein
MGLKRFMGRTLAVVVAGLVVAVVPGSLVAAGGSVLYVDRANAACTDTGSGTADQPFCTISAAAAVATAGQTVQVASGTYPERVVVSSSGTSSAPLVFAAADGATATLSGQANGFYLSGRSWVTIKGFNIIHTTDYGIAVNTSSHVILANNHVSYSGQPLQGYTKYGIRLNNVSDSIVSGNTTDHNSNAGIGLVSGSTRDQVLGNISFSNAEGYQRSAAGIHLYQAPGNTVAGNVTHDNEDSGINCYPGSNGCIIYNNVTYNNGDHGIDDSFAPNATIVANTVYKNVTAGINVEGQATGGALANNISVDNGIGSPRTHSDIRVESGSTAGTTMDYDLVYLTRADTLLIWNSVSYTSLAAFQAASGQETHGIQADPKWANPTGGDFHLLAGSPAIDSANSGATSQPNTDVEQHPRVDDPATPNTGTGPRTYDDRGAYERQTSALDHIVISPTSASINAGGSQAFTAQGFESDGSSVDVTAATTFSISPDGSCNANICAAIVAGPHTVTANDAGKTSTASLAVNPGPLDHLSLSPASATIAAGGAQAYTAQARDQYGNPLGDVTTSTTFSISPDGSCVGASCSASLAGLHTVTGSDGGKTGTASLTVTAGPLDHLVLSPSSASIPSGGSQSYTAEGRDQYDNSLGDVTASTTFSIAPDGSCVGASCTASFTGTHTVTGTDAGKTGTSSLEVTSGIVVDHIVISPSGASIGAGGSQSYTAQGFDSSGNSLGDVTSSTSFSISPNGSCSGNVCTATAAGAHTVTGYDGGKTSTASLTVNPGPLDHLSLSPSSATIPSGGSQSYTAQARDQYDNPLGDVTASTTFSIAPDGSCTGATCTASAAGAHTVTGTSSSKTGTASLTVGAGALDHIVISPSSATIGAGGSQAYSAQGFDAANNSLGDVTAFTTFSIAPEGSCVGSACTANAGGPHTVTGNDGGKTATAPLTVSYVRNSGFETDLSGWNTSGSGANITLTRVSGGHSGNWAAKLTNTGTTTSTFATLQDSPNWVTTTTAGTYSATVWVRSDTAGAILKLKFQEYSGGTLVGSASSQITLSTTWQQLTLPYQIKSPGSTLDLQIFAANPAPGTAFYADDATIVLG